MSFLPTKSLFPFISGDGTKELPKVYGSGVLLRVDAHYFLLSAAHVFDDTATDIFLPGGIEVPTPEQRPSYFTTEAPGNNRTLDKIDLGATKLSTHIAEQLIQQGYEFATVGEIDLEDPPVADKKYLFTGFPGTGSKTIFSLKTIRAHRQAFSLTAIESTQLPQLGWVPQLNFAGRFIRNEMVNQEGIRINAPEPLGMSGGGVWTEKPDGQFKFVGIGIEWDERNGILIGTRLGILVELIKARHPETLPYLPRCSYLDITIG